MIDDPAAAGVSLDPVRARLLAELAVPGSATTLAAKIGLPRQKVNYHLRTLEQHGLVELVEERRRGNMTERVMQATAASYVISPAALGAVAPDPGAGPRPALRPLADRRRRPHACARSASCWPGRRRRASGWPPSPSTARSGSPPRPTGPPSPRSWPARSPRWSASYHDETAPGGRPHRVVVAVHPHIRREER